jgi:surface polysaccharide O-acyltransferase-like enzyme
MEQAKQKKLLFADYMRVLATLSVILLHCAGDYLYQFKLGEMDVTRWWICNIYDSSVRWCVPVFVMLSGVLLLRPKKVESIPDFLKKRMMRVFIPFLFLGFYLHLLCQSSVYLRYSPTLLARCVVQSFF